MLRPRARPDLLCLLLRLFHDPNARVDPKKPVVSEKYDEFVFVNPSPQFMHALNAGPVRRLESPLTQYCKGVLSSLPLFAVVCSVLSLLCLSSQSMRFCFCMTCLHCQHLCLLACPAVAAAGMREPDSAAQFREQQHKELEMLTRASEQVQQQIQVLR